MPPTEQEKLDLTIARVLIDQDADPLSTGWTTDHTEFIVVDHMGRKTRHTAEQYHWAHRQMTVIKEGLDVARAAMVKPSAYSAPPRAKKGKK